MAKDDQSVSFSSREMEVLALAWQCMETEPKVRPYRTSHTVTGEMPSEGLPDFRFHMTKMAFTNSL